MDIDSLEVYIRHYIFYINRREQPSNNSIKKIINAIKNKEDKEIDINLGFKVFIFGEKTFELIKNNSKIYFIFKVIRNREHEKFCLLRVDKSKDFFYSVISSEVKNNLLGETHFDKALLKNLNIFEVTKFNTIILSMFENTDNYKKKRIEEMLGKDVYKDIFSFFIKYENLVLANGVIQMY